MTPRIETGEAKVFRRNRNKSILCRLTCEVTPFRQNLFRWSLVSIEELE